ncbi:4-alpha-D-((1-4)-alpha-D-glucano)trehalose trehalohydrolase [Streptomyces himastatinicus ATCC 53653]|uniref:4-alpha-D-((1-4)-alpha-D-glucano)trehalose trehalohydrolase n=1 Tax=Streptomyces himastatinicus ATCC 53653 TaxID=457427 RepID=D9W870_9ACTN|nr:4-alpha-D-((1-4)-alpha-D-glucano)trehalose trehalohydrolase [Streptomyces himastatinicus ATCC 53653]
MFEVWAPHAGQVGLHIVRGEGRTHPMERDPGREGWWRAEAAAGHGALYGFALDDGPPLPDPRSRRQPDGPEGLSAVVDHSRFPWEREWSGRPLPGAVLYELHIGTFTPEGTFDAAAARLPHLAGLGITHVELMPVCPFPGTHGWGYDGVAPWAVHEPYGGPEGLARFVAAAHRHGLGVVLDVVHNHLGPSGNRLPDFGPYFTDTHHTPWGAAVNLDAPGSDEVRAYFIGSALAWLRDFRLDGLRLDAVHALHDTRARHFLAELSAAVDALAAEVGRPLFLIGESDLNDPRTTTPREAGRPRTPRPVERRLPSRPAHVPHRRTGRLLRRLRRRGARGPGQDAERRLLPRRHVLGVPGPPSRQPAEPAHHPRAPAPRLRPDARSGGEPRDRRPAVRPALPRAAGLRGGRGAVRAVHPDALHGRGVGRGDALAVLHRPPGPGAGRRGTARPPPRVRRPRLGGGGHPGSAGPGDPAAVLPGLDGAGPGAAPGAAGLAPAADRAAPRRARPDRPRLVVRPAGDGS